MNEQIIEAIQHGDSLFPHFERELRKRSPGKPTREWVKRDAMRIEATSVLLQGARKKKVVEVFYLPFGM